MDWKLHVLVSFLAYFLIVSLFRFQPLYSVQALLVLVFFSMLPDVDHPKSVIRKVVFIIIFYLMMLFVVIELAIDIPTKTAIMLIYVAITYYFYKNLPLSHRGKRSLHLWRYPFIFAGLFLVFSVAAGMNISLCLFVLIGYGLHLLSDRIRDF